VVWADDPQGAVTVGATAISSRGTWPKSATFTCTAAIGTARRLSRVVGGHVDCDTAAPRDGPSGLGYEWNVTNGANGPQYGGTGRGGQTLIVWPELDMVVVSMAGGNAGQVAQLVRAAVRSAQALPANAEAVAALGSKAAGAAQAPAASAAAVLPPMAATISGTVYDFPVNSSRLDSLSLSFAKNGDARVDVQYYGQPLSFPVGLDGVYRLGPNGPSHLQAGAMGKWTSDAEFALDLNFIANINHYTMTIRFQGDRIDVTVNEASGLIRNGHLVGQKRPQ